MRLWHEKTDNYNRIDKTLNVINAERIYQPKSNIVYNLEMETTIEIKESVNKNTYNKARTIIDTSSMSENDAFAALLEFAVKTNLLRDIVASKNLNNIQTLGYIDDDGITVLPSDMYDRETDGLYDDLFKR